MSTMVVRQLYELQVPTEWEKMKPVGDLMANTIVFATIFGWLPTVAAALSVIWGVMRVYETYLDIKKKRKNIDVPYPIHVPIAPGATLKIEPGKVDPKEPMVGTDEEQKQPK